MIWGAMWLITVSLGRRGHLDRGGLEMKLRSKGGEPLMIEGGIGGRDLDSEAKETARFIFIRDVNIHEQRRRHRSLSGRSYQPLFPRNDHRRKHLK